MPIADKEEKKLLIGETFDIRFERFKFIHQNYQDIIYPWIKIESYKIERVDKKIKEKNKKLNVSESERIRERERDKDIKSNGKKIAVLIVRNKNARHNIIFSHGNSSDLATMYPLLLDMSTQFKVK